MMHHWCFYYCMTFNGGICVRHEPIESLLYTFHSCLPANWPRPQSPSLPETFGKSYFLPSSLIQESVMSCSHATKLVS